MKLNQLEDKKGNVDIDLKIIWDQSEPKEMFGRMTKAVLVADVDSVQGDGSPTAYLDIYGDDIEKFKHMDKIRVTNAYSKKILGREQFRITNAKKIELIWTH